MATKSRRRVETALAAAGLAAIAALYVARALTRDGLPADIGGAARIAAGDGVGDGATAAGGISLGVGGGVAAFAVSTLRGLALVGFGYAAACSDLLTRKVPNRLVLAMLCSWTAFTVASVFVDAGEAASLLVQSLIGGAAAGGFFLFVYLVSRKGLGGGDVKFIAVAGLFLTFSKVMPMLFFASLLAALASAALLLLKRVTMKSSIPLVPFLYIGTLIAVFA